MTFENCYYKQTGVLPTLLLSTTAFFYASNNLQNFLDYSLPKLAMGLKIRINNDTIVFEVTTSLAQNCVSLRLTESSQVLAVKLTETCNRLGNGDYFPFTNIEPERSTQTKVSK